MARTAKARRLSVCLLYTHPLVAERFREVLPESQFLIRAQRLEGTPADQRRVALPPARIYVLENAAPQQVTAALIHRVVESHPDSRVVVLAEKFTEANSFPFLRMGAKGLLTYGESAQYLPRTLQAVAAGGYWVPRTILSRFVESVLRNVRGGRSTLESAGLSQREQQVLDSLLDNLSNKEIASKLYISERTVKFHVSNLLAKFGVQRRADLILLCYQQRGQQ